MATAPRIPVGKKRYTVTLTEKHVERIKAYLTSKGYPQSVFSLMIDDCVQGLATGVIPMLERVEKEGKKLNIGDFFSLAGQMMSDGIEHHLSGKQAVFQNVKGGLRCGKRSRNPEKRFV